MLRAKRFYCRRNKDAADEYIKLLRAAGYFWVATVEEADFLLMDHDWIGYGGTDNYQRALLSRPMFIYPHTPYSFFLWDGIWKIAPNVLCNFVVGHTAVEAMKLYGYPHRVEAIGFTGCEIKPFQPTTGTKLLFAPQHPLHDKKMPIPEQMDWAREASHWIIKNLSYFESVTVRYTNTLKLCGLEEFEGQRVCLQHVDPYNTPNIREKALVAIDKADMVISIGTFGFLSIASGKPTVLVGYRDSVANTREGNAKHYELYRHLMHFPLVFEDMTINEVLQLRHAPHPQVEEWKQNNIGEPFNAEKFMSVIKEYF